MTMIVICLYHGQPQKSLFEPGDQSQTRERYCSYKRVVTVSGVITIGAAVFIIGMATERREISLFGVFVFHEQDECIVNC
jgi:hypothetical protein